MIKVIATSDWHMDAVTAGRSRLSDWKDYMTTLRAEIKREKPDVVVCMGDVFDPGAMSAHALTSLLIDEAFDLADLAATVVFIAGNHDVVETSEGWTTMSPLAAAVRAADMGSRIVVMERPEFQNFGSFSVVGLPYVARAARGHVSGPDVPKDHANPLLVFGHMTVPGAVLGNESAEMARGSDLDFPEESVAKWRPALVMNGHYHKAQVVQKKGFEIVIPGSPLRLSFGEKNDKQKGYTVAVVD